MDEGNGNPRESEDRYRHINSAESQCIDSDTFSSLPEAGTSNVCSSLCYTGGIINQPSDSGFLKKKY